MPRKRHDMATCEEPSETPPVQLGKCKFLESLDESEYAEDMELSVACNVLNLSKIEYNDFVVLKKYLQLSQDPFSNKGELDRAFQTFAAQAGSNLKKSQHAPRLCAKGSPAKLKQIALNGLNFNINANFEAGRFCDLTVRCQDRSWSVHRLVLCSSSEYFDKCVSNDNFLENRESQIELYDDDPATVEQLLRFLYTGDYQLPCSIPPAFPTLAWKFHVAMYIIADKYGLVALNFLARQRLDSILVTMKFTEQNISVFLEVVRSIYGTVLAEKDEKMRELLGSLLREHRVALKKNSDFMDLVGSGLGDGLFARDVVKALIPE